LPIIDVAAIGNGFLALGMGDAESDSPYPAWFASPDGSRWERTQLLTGPIRLTGFATRDDAVVLVGGVEPGFHVEPHAWLSTAGRLRNVSVSGIAGAFRDVAAGSHGFVIAGSTILDTENRFVQAPSHFGAAWQSSDGARWRPIDLESEEGSVVQEAAAATFGILMRGHREVPEFGMVTTPYAWFVPPGTNRAKPLDLDFNIWGITATDEQFIGLGSCQRQEGDGPGCPLVVFATPR
jgi:hypothetical protein